MFQIAATDKGREEVRWDDVMRALIITSAGPWGEDVFFVLESSEDRVIEAMGSTSKNTFVIWERSTTSVV